VLLAGLGPRGSFDGGYTNLSNIATDVTTAKESHHFYPVLFYFRFDAAYYSVSSITLMSFDVVTLIRSALDEEQGGWLERSAAVRELWWSALTLARMLEEAFVHGENGEGGDDNGEVDGPTRERWRLRYRLALKRLREGGIRTVRDERAGAEMYIALRAQWEHDIAALAPMMDYAMEEIDPAGTRPERQGTLLTR
jgi:hypothetical protein